MAERIASRLPFISRIKDQDNDIRLAVNGIYASEDLIFIQFELENRSNLKYDIDQLRIFVKDQKKSKRTATQEIEVVPVYVFGNQQSINALSSQTVVFVVPKFNIPDQKYVTVQMLEKNGGRNLELRVRNSLLMAAKTVARIF